MAGYARRKANPSDPGTYALSPPQALAAPNYGGNTGGGGDPSSSGKAVNPEDQLKNILGGLSYNDASAPDKALVQEIGELIGSQPLATAQNLLKLLPKNSGLTTAVNNYLTSGQSQTGAPQQPKPIWDPLALQTMWSSVFGPIFDQVKTIAGNSSQQYQNAMNNAIAGSNLPASQKALDTSDSN